MSRKAFKFYEKTSKNLSWELSDADGSQGLLSGSSGLAGVLGKGRAWGGQNIFSLFSQWFCLKSGTIEKPAFCVCCF